MKIIIFIFISFVTLFANELLQARAVIISMDRTILSSEIAGNILFFPKGEGASFLKGDILVKIDCQLYDAQYEKVKLEANIAKLQLEKNQQLESYNSIGAFEVEISKEEFKKANAQLKIVNLNKQRCKIFAPFDGKIVEKKVKQFQNVQPQQELLEIISTKNLEAKLVVPSSWLQWLKKGQDISLHVDETNEQIKAQIKEIGAAIDTTSQTVTLRAGLKKPYNNILPGMSATASFTR